MSILEVKSVSKSFGSGEQKVEVLSDVNLSIREGEFVAIVGFSGSGKTTLISAIAGNGILITAPSEHSIFTLGVVRACVVFMLRTTPRTRRPSTVTTSMLSLP